MIDFIIRTIQDGFFAAIAAIGFGSISNIPLKAFKGCALLAALGHMTRYLLMYGANWSIIGASFIAALVIGISSIFVAKEWKCPAESFSFPALLPMIPGMYAYRTVQALIKCLENSVETQFNHYFYLLNYNWMMCVIIVILMVIGVTLPIFAFSKTSFQVTKQHISNR